MTPFAELDAQNRHRRLTFSYFHWEGGAYPAAAFGLTAMINQAAIRARSWLFTPATRPDRFAKAAAAGAYASKGGKSIIAATSTAAHGKISRIVPRLQGPVTTPRIDTHYVVTEFGSANLKGLSSTERAHVLIGLAHPEFRDELLASAKKLHLV